MRIRLWNAYASNNSGSYTIVGRFETAEAAEALVRDLAPMLREHTDWHMARPEARAAEPPLHRFLRARDIPFDEREGLGDEWPEYGPEPEVTAVGAQVLLHCSYTVSMPRALGALIFQAGGRVEVEIDHAHETTVLLFEVWMHDAWVADREDSRKAALLALRDALIAGPLASPGVKGIPFAWRLGYHGRSLEIGAAFQDPVAGARVVGELARAHAAEVRVRAFETPHGVADPLAFMRGGRVPTPGAYALTLFAAGPDRAATLRALQGVMGGDEHEARAVLDRLPAEVLRCVSREDAEAGCTQLWRVGADAGVVGGAGEP